MGSDESQVSVFGRIHKWWKARTRRKSETTCRKLRQPDEMKAAEMQNAGSAAQWPDATSLVLASVSRASRPLERNAADDGKQSTHANIGKQ